MRYPLQLALDLLVAPLLEDRNPALDGLDLQTQVLGDELAHPVAHVLWPGAFLPAPLPSARAPLQSPQVARMPNDDPPQLGVLFEDPPQVTYARYEPLEVAAIRLRTALADAL